MSYVNLDPRIETDFELNLAKLDLSVLWEVFSDEVRAQALTDLKEACPPGWDFDEVSHDGLELRDGKLYIVNVSAEHATFDEDAAREAFQENEWDAARTKPRRRRGDAA